MNIIVMKVNNSAEFNAAMQMIMDNAASIPAVEMPQDFVKEVTEEPFNMTTAQRWVGMVKQAKTGADVRKVREALGMSGMEFARRWGSTAPNIYTMEKKDGNLQKRSLIKLATVVSDRIAELAG